MSYPDLTSNTTTLGAFKQQVISALSTSTGVDPSLIAILALYPGSVNVILKVTAPANKAFGGADPVALAKLDAALTALTTSAASTFNTTFQTSFKVTAVTAVTLVSPSSPAMVTGTSKLVTPLVVGIAVGVGGFLTLAAIITAIFCLRRGRKICGVVPKVAHVAKQPVCLVVPKSNYISEHPEALSLKAPEAAAQIA